MRVEKKKVFLSGMGYTYERGVGVTLVCLSGAAHAALRQDGRPRYALAAARRHGFRGCEHKQT
jgi:diaminopimelate epimerase